MFRHALTIIGEQDMIRRKIELHRLALDLMRTPKEKKEGMVNLEVKEGELVT
jgi:hypothetical protein